MLLNWKCEVGLWILKGSIYGKSRVKGLTWITLSEVKVGEVDNIVVALLSLVEEPEFCRSSHHIVCHHALQYKTIKEGRRACFDILCEFVDTTAV